VDRNIIKQQDWVNNKTTKSIGEIGEEFDGFRNIHHLKLVL